jgi:hypothetical protein
MNYVIGVSVGRMGEGWALALIAMPGQQKGEVRHLERRPRENVPQLVARLETLLPALPTESRVEGNPLALDTTETGKPIVDMIRNARASCALHSVAIAEKTSTNLWCHEARERDLFANVSLMMQAGTLRIARDLPLAGSLERALAAVRIDVTPTSASLAPPRREHDGLVMALAVGAWIAEKMNACERDLEGWKEVIRQQERAYEEQQHRDWRYGW